MSEQKPWHLTVAGPATRDIARLPEKYATAIVEALDEEMHTVQVVAVAHRADVYRPR